jgi:hypothetical protein
MALGSAISRPVDSAVPGAGAALGELSKCSLDLERESAIVPGGEIGRLEIVQDEIGLRRGRHRPHRFSVLPQLVGR